MTLDVIIALEAQNTALREALEQDAADLWRVTNAIKSEIEARTWILEGRGPYQWDDDRYRQEARLAFEAVLKLIGDVQPLAANRFHAALKGQQPAPEQES